MSLHCLNCGSEISTSARVCPYCHLSPYDPYATQPYAHMEERSSGGPLRVDPLTAGVIGALMLPVFPIAGAAMIGVGILAKVLNRRNE
jgi:hypothetical protein